MDSLLRARHTAGAYAELSDPASFSARLQRDMLSVYLDKHLIVGALPPEASGADGASAEPNPDRAEGPRRNNYGFKKVQILPGNVGYLELTQFADAAVAGGTAVGAMNFLANADALIIDLRENGGGHASMIQLLTGYFLAEPAHLVSWYKRATNETEQSWSQAYVPGKRMPDTPLFVLTSSFTGSAAEEFAYDLKNLERATIVGETTGGAAHTIELHFFDFGSFRTALQVPAGRSISPITKTNWEAVGVTPDIAVPASNALLTAQAEALKLLTEKAASERDKYGLAWAQTGLDAELNPVTLTVKELKEYAGKFGPRTLSLEGSHLTYQREGRPKLRLVPMGKDLFGAEEAAYFRLRFTRDEAGRIDGVIGMYDNGRQDREAKTK
ncbi:MAG: S41 family peptidase [Candidatus Eisenbacteria bacterium]